MAGLIGTAFLWIVKNRTRTLGIVLVVLVLFLQCSRSRLKDLREKHQMLEAEYAAVQASLHICSEAASLQDALLMERERENFKVTTKYNNLRDNFLRGLLSVDAEGKIHEADVSDWCARPVPDLVRSLLTTNAQVDCLPGTTGGSANGDSVPGISKTGAKY